MITLVVMVTLATFSYDYEHDIEYEYYFRILTSPHPSLLLTSREGGSRNTIGVTHCCLKHANNTGKVLLVLDIILVLRSQGPY